MHFQEMLFGERFGAFENSPGLLVHVAHLALLLVRHAHDAQGENFVDLGGVEKIARTFGGDLGIIIENDRRRDHGILFALFLFPHEDRPCSDILASRRAGRDGRRRIDEGKKLAALHLQNGMGRSKRSHEHGILVLHLVGGKRTAIDDANRYPEKVGIERFRGDLDDSLDGFLPAQDHSCWTLLLVMNALEFARSGKMKRDALDAIQEAGGAVSVR